MTRPLTRRRLLQRAALGGAALTLPAWLAACGGDGIEGAGNETDEGSGAVDRTLANTLVISNWPLYIDIDEKTKKRPTIQDFMDEFGVNVRYIEDVNDNEEWFGKFQAQLDQGDDIGRDIAVVTDWMAARMIRLGYVEKLDKQTIPNASNLQDALRSPSWDRNREYTLPWQSGLTGIAYNKKVVPGGVKSIGQLLTDPALKGKVTALTELPDTMGLVIADNGDDPEKVTDESYQTAIDKLQAAVDSGQIRRFTGNDYADDLSAGNVVAAIAWSGDVVQLQLDNPNLEFVIPEAGAHLFTDNMLIPTGGHVFTASTFMNYVYEPDVAAQIEAYVNYICPVKGAQEAIREIDESLAQNPLIFPDAATLEKTFIFDATASDNPDYREKFQTVIGA
jgi:spermidine/putrescine transport system substrate-binding protein